MNTICLPPAVLLKRLAAAQPTLLENAVGLCGHQRLGEAFRTCAALAERSDAATPFKLAALYYVGGDDVRAALSFLVGGGETVEGPCWAEAA